ncbi:MAG: helix-turn-helix transcriptional regulator [Smithella sp.]
MFDNHFFGQHVRQLRQSIGLSLQDVADFIGTQKSSLANIERGDKSPSINMMLNLANYFGVSLDYLTGRSDNPRHDEFIEKSEKEVLVKLLSDNFTSWLVHMLPDLYRDLELRRKTYSIDQRLKIVFVLRELIKENLEYKTAHQKILKSFEPTLANEVKKRIFYSWNKEGLIDPSMYTVPTLDESEKHRQLYQKFHELVFGELQEEYIEEPNSKPSFFKKKRYTKIKPIDPDGSETKH